MKINYEETKRPTKHEKVFKGSNTSPIQGTYKIKQINKTNTKVKKASLKHSETN